MLRDIVVHPLLSWGRESCPFSSFEYNVLSCVYDITWYLKTGEVRHRQYYMCYMCTLYSDRYVQGV